MVWLLLASIVWGFSFGILKGLVTEIDPFVINMVRTGLAALFFAPWFILSKSRNSFLKQKNSDTSDKSEENFKLATLLAFICGSVQIGLMYCPYALAFRFIKAHEVALFTMTTPIIMAIIITIRPSVRTMEMSLGRIIILMLAAVIATIGGMIATWNDISSSNLMAGAVLVQISNLFFAAGSLLWTKWFAKKNGSSSYLMAPYFVGAWITSAVISLIFSTGEVKLSPIQILAMAWLGIVSSGLGFFMWNKGATSVSQTTLTIANNVKLPIAIVISIFLFDESANLPNLTCGIVLITLALWMVVSPPKTKPQHL